MHDGSSTVPGFAIPGWRVIRSDAGRYWASRVDPFPAESEWYAPPYRTVDGDTFEQLRTEVAFQEEAARKQKAAAGEAGDGETTGRETGGTRATGTRTAVKKARVKGTGEEVIA